MTNINNLNEIIAIKRVCYGKKGTEIKKREYRIFHCNSVGCLTELIEFCDFNLMELDGFFIVDTIDTDFTGLHSIKEIKRLIK